MPPLHDVEFATTVAELHALPPQSVAEVAFAGRSNAGKSSALNTLARRKRLAFVSKTPGRTQNLNFFTAGPDRYLVDLPGYGYAAAAASVRSRWNELVGGYLQTRTVLRGVILVMDIRHSFSELDLRMLDWIAPTQLPAHVLLSKSDKLGKQQAQAALAEAVTLLRRNYVTCSVQLFSSLRKVGVDEATNKVASWLHGAKE